MIEPEHARLAPSSAHIWTACPASVAMQEAEPPEEESDESREGTAAHWLLAQILRKLPVADNAVADNGVPINDEMREAVQEIVTDIQDTLAACTPGQFFYAVESTIGAPGIHSDVWGTPDCYCVDYARKTIHIWDFKYGHRFVDVYECPQLLVYFFCVVEDTKIADWQEWAVTFTIAQPRCYVSDELGSTLRVWFTSGEIIAPWRDFLILAARAASSPEAECGTGDHCRDCRAQWDCVANHRCGGVSVDIAYQARRLGMRPNEIGLEMKVLRDAAERLKARISALEAQAIVLADDGASIAYHRVEFTNTRTVWAKDKQEEAAQIVNMFGDNIARLGIALPTPRECVKRGIDESVIKPYVTKAPGSKKLVRVSDNSALKIFGPRS